MLLLISRRSEHIREVMKKSVDFHKIKTDSGTLITFLTFLKQHTAEIQKIFGCTCNRFILLISFQYFRRNDLTGTTSKYRFSYRYL